MTQKIALRKHGRIWFIRHYLQECCAATEFFAIEVTIPKCGFSALVIPRRHMEAFMFEFGTISKVKRAEALKGGYANGAPCLRIRDGEAIHRDEAAKWASDHEGAYLIEALGGRGYTHNAMRDDAKALGYPTAGHYFEALVASRLGWFNIGSRDKQSHTRHSDLLSPLTGRQLECKLYTGIFTLQYERNWTWSDNDND